MSRPSMAFCQAMGLKSRFGEEKSIVVGIAMRLSTLSGTVRSWLVRGLTLG